MDERSVAYFSMEIALQSVIPSYAGGLGVLAGDTIRSAADMRLPVVAVSLLSRIHRTRSGRLTRSRSGSFWNASGRTRPSIWTSGRSRSVTRGG